MVQVWNTDMNKSSHLVPSRLSTEFNDDAKLGIYIRSPATLLGMQCYWDQPDRLLLYLVVLSALNVIEFGGCSQLGVVQPQLLIPLFSWLIYWLFPLVD